MIKLNSNEDTDDIQQQENSDKCRKRTNSICGSWEHISPEMHKVGIEKKGDYDSAVDLWNL